MAQDIINKILYEYDELRAAAERKRALKIQEVYKEYPEIEDIDKQIKSMGFANMKSIMMNPSKGDEINAEFKKNIEVLGRKRKELIKKYRIDPNFDKPKYSCNICSDTGYVNNKKCECFKQRLKTEEYKTSNLEHLVKKQNFDTFNIDFYSNEKDENGESPKSRMKKIIKVSKRFCDNFDKEEKSLLFHGNPGLGKTFLSSCISKELIDKGKSVLYIRSTKLFSIYDDYKFGNCENKDEYESIIKKVYNCDLLIIDDFGTEFMTKSSYSFLFDFFNERIYGGKKMIINTNLTLKQIAENYNERFASRLYEYFLILGFKGEDIRTKY